MIIKKRFPFVYAHFYRNIWCDSMYDYLHESHGLICILIVRKCGETKFETNQYCTGHFVSHSNCWAFIRPKWQPYANFHRRIKLGGLHSIWINVEFQAWIRSNATLASTLLLITVQSHHKLFFKTAQRQATDIVYIFAVQFHLVGMLVILFVFFHIFRQLLYIFNFHCR